MKPLILLLRGVNIGGRRVSMPELRELLSAAAFTDVRTYVQSGNLVLCSKKAPETAARECERLIAERFGFEVPVIARTRDELADVIRRDPLGEVAENPKRYQVTFLSDELDPARLEKLLAVAAPHERLVASGRELYSWHPEGVARSKLWGRIAGADLGVTATARNWNTVTTLLEIADP